MTFYLAGSISITTRLFSQFPGLPSSLHLHYDFFIFFSLLSTKLPIWNADLCRDIRHSKKSSLERFLTRKLGGTWEFAFIHPGYAFAKSCNEIIANRKCIRNSRELSLFLRSGQCWDGIHLKLVKISLQFSRNCFPRFVSSSCVRVIWLAKLTLPKSPSAHSM